jgi:N-acetylglucosaminyldiphosphoundecaprenol N-acetyl-beta-D-mannosaminyltransferase
MRRTGLEWLFRLSQDPRRLARRYVVGNAQFIWLVLRERARPAAGRPVSGRAP